MTQQLPPLNASIAEHAQKLAARPEVAAALADLKANAPEAMKLQVHLCEIPAPTFHEEVRAAEIQRLMKSYGLEDVQIDEIGNVVGRRPGKGNGPLLAIGAHMDTVFPEGTPIKVRREGNRYYGPGIGDNCSGLRAMLEVLRAMQKANLETEGDILFIGTVGEEGNGDIRGSKHLFNTRKDIDGFLAVDNTDVTRILHTAIGAHRWRVTVQGTGGHSYAAFGKVPSAIHAVCMAGAKIAHIKVPEAPVTTFTIGTIKGGTSVNTIAPSCSVDIDVRSFENGPIEAIDKQIVAAFQEAIEEEHRIWGDHGPGEEAQPHRRADRRPPGRDPSARLPRHSGLARGAEGARDRIEELRRVLDRRQHARFTRHPRDVPLGRRLPDEVPHDPRVLRRHRPASRAAARPSHGAGTRGSEG